MSRSPAPRDDFPALADGATVYLDSAATTQMPSAVIEALTEALRRGRANVGRGVYAWAERADDAHAEARAKVARFFDAEPEALVFVSGATEALSAVADGWAAPRLDPGDRVLLTGLEHHANLLPWQRLTRERGLILERIALDPAGRLDLEDLRARLPGARLLALTALSNVLGTSPPLVEICALARDEGVVTVVDGAQAAGRLPLSLRAIGCDFLAVSAHKMLGPTGIGALLASPERLEQMRPLRLGGGMVLHVPEGELEPRYRPAPHRHEAGTPNLEGALGMAAACAYLEGVGLERIRAHERALTAALREALSRRPRVRLFGPEESLGVVSFTLEGCHPHDVASILDEEGIAVRAGHHCAEPLMRALGIRASLRASFGPYSEPADIEALMRGLDRAEEVLG